MMSSWQMTPTILERRTICTWYGVIWGRFHLENFRGNECCFLWPGKIRWVLRGLLPGIVFFMFFQLWWMSLFEYVWNMDYIYIYILWWIYDIGWDMMDYIYIICSYDIGWDMMGPLRVYMFMICLIIQVDKMHNHRICFADRMFYVELMMDGTWLSNMDDLWIRYDLWKENSLSLFFWSYK